MDNCQKTINDFFTHLKYIIDQENSRILNK